MEFTEGTDVDIEENFAEMGDTELPDDDPVQCGSEFCVICNEMATDQRQDERVSGRYLDSQNLVIEIPRRYLKSGQSKSGQSKPG